MLPQAGAAANVEARTSYGEPSTRLMAIEQVQVGQRVRADAPTDEFDLKFGSPVVAGLWPSHFLRTADPKVPACD